MIFDLKQVRRYFSETDLRHADRERLKSAITPETRVLIAHPLGAVIAHECLCAHPEWDIRAFITLGSPLGIRNLIVHRLDPQSQDNLGAWPGSERAWTNIADAHDIVALEKKLQPYFAGDIRDVAVCNGGLAHDVNPYFTAAETGAAIQEGLAELVIDNRRSDLGFAAKRHRLEVDGACSSPRTLCQRQTCMACRACPDLRRGGSARANHGDQNDERHGRHQ